MQTLFQSPDFSKLVYLTLASIGLAISIIIDQAQLIAKFSGALKKRVAGGYNTAMKIMVLNRFGAALYFMFIALSIDLGMQASVIGIFFFAAICVVAVFDIVTAVRLAVKYRLMLIDLVDAQLSLSPVFMSMIASMFGILGLTLPMLLSSANPELRLTMANTGFLLNSVFTIITVFFVESYLAKIIDDPDQQHRMILFVTAVFVLRFFGAVLAIVVLLLLSHNAASLNLGQWLRIG